MADLVLAIDIGTSSVRAIAFDTSGRAVDPLRAQVHYAPETDDSGAATFDADWLVEQAVSCIDQVVGHVAGTKDRILAVGTTTFWHSMVGIDSEGRAVTPLITWADTRPGDAAARLKTALDPSAYHARTGCAIHSSYFPARLNWLSESDPEMFGRAAKWVSPGEFLYQTLFGHSACSICMASGTGLLNQNACDWDDETIAALPITRSNLSTLTDLDAPAMGLTEPWRSRWPELADVPWVPAIGDGAASNLGSGCDTERRIAINLGTSGAIRVMWQADNLEIPLDLWCYRLDRARADGGSVQRWGIGL
jgi:gluconokinase